MGNRTVTIFLFECGKHETVTIDARVYDRMMEITDKDRDLWEDRGISLMNEAKRQLAVS